MAIQKWVECLAAVEYDGLKLVMGVTLLEVLRPLEDPFILSPRDTLEI